MDPKTFFGAIRAHWWYLLAAGLVGTSIGAAVTIVQTPEYTATTEVFVTAEAGDNTSDLAQGSNFTQQQARNYAVVATREIVLAPVVTTLDLPFTAAELSTRVSASVPLNTSLISIEVSDASPARAAAIADAVSASLADAVLELVPARSDGTSPVRMETVQSAAVPDLPSSPAVMFLLLVGALLGVAVGGVMAVVRETLRGRVRTQAEARALGLSIVGTITDDRSVTARPVLTSDDALSTRAEEFRQLRTNLRFLQAGGGHKVFVVTSSVPGEGKSTTAVNIATSLAADGTRVCLVEADLRKPALGPYLDLETAVGFTGVLAREVKLDDALQPWGPDGLQVLLAGIIPPNPSELLGSKEAESLLGALRRRFDVVIIDSPPLLPVTDATILGRLFGGVLLVVGAGIVQSREARLALDALQASGVPVLGAVVNRVPSKSVGRYAEVYRDDGTAEGRGQRRLRAPRR